MELIKVKNSSYSRYEELLLMRDSVRKEALQIELSYTRIFGGLEVALFKKKIECIRKKKAIAFMQASASRGEKVDEKAMQEHIAKGMKELESKLKGMIEDRDAAVKSAYVSHDKLKKIKEIYRRIAKQIHPDINPVTDEDEDLKDLWIRVGLAYSCNNLHELEELEDYVNICMAKLKDKTVEVYISDIDKKISQLEKDIEIIKSKEPYTFKEILESESLTAKRKDELLAEIESYKEYSAQLDTVMEGLMEKGVTLTWLMN